MRILPSFLALLVAISSSFNQAAEVTPDDIKTLQKAVRNIEGAILKINSLSSELTLTEHSLVLRSWLSTIYTPLSMIYKMGHNIPLFSEKQSKSGELIQFARLTVVLASKQETLNAAMGTCTNSAFLRISYFKFLRAIPAFEEKRNFILRNVYKADLPVQQRLLMRAFCYILFNSLDFFMLSPTLLFSPSVRTSAPFFETSTSNLYEFLRYTIEVVEHIGALEENSEQLSDLFLEAIDMEGRFYEQFLGDLLDEDHMNHLKHNLKIIAREIIKIVTKEGFQLNSRLPLEYIRPK